MTLLYHKIIFLLLKKMFHAKIRGFHDVIHSNKSMPSTKIPSVKILIMAIFANDKGLFYWFRLLALLCFALCYLWACQVLPMTLSRRVNMIWLSLRSAASRCSVSQLKCLPLQHWWASVKDDKLYRQRK